MPDAPSARDRLLPPLASHVLRHGLTDASLRPLARAAGTSDRMLIYHFGSKDGLIAALLTHLAADFAALLSRLSPPEGFATVEAAVAHLTRAQMHPEAADYVRLWLEIVAAAARGSAVHRQTGAAILSGLSDWLAQRLPPGARAEARAALVRIEGEMVLWALGLSDPALAPPSAPR
jgi:AcrR family transcriptional regulator